MFFFIFLFYNDDHIKNQIVATIYIVCIVNAHECKNKWQNKDIYEKKPPKKLKKNWTKEVICKRTMKDQKCRIMLKYKGKMHSKYIFILLFVWRVWKQVQKQQQQQQQKRWKREHFRGFNRNHEFWSILSVRMTFFLSFICKSNLLIPLDYMFFNKWKKNSTFFFYTNFGVCMSVVC